jgi:formamidopyrimidine-DNA glycosylase
MLEAMREGGSCAKLEVKAALLSQELLFSGIGNWLADEVLYQSHIHPKTRCSALDPVMIQALGEAIIRVCQTAAQCSRAGEEFPVEYLFHYRWEKSKKAKKKGENGEGDAGSPRGAKDAFGNAITFETVGGRTSAVVPAVQRVLQLPASASASDGVIKEKKKRKALDVPAATATATTSAAPAAAARPAKKTR